MARCQGTTLKGQRCRREARSGSGYCSIHEDQAPASRGGGEGVQWDGETLLKTALGFALLGAIVLLRLRR